MGVWTLPTSKKRKLIGGPLRENNYEKRQKDAGEDGASHKGTRELALEI
jgi:hypothetical protein